MEVSAEDLIQAFQQQFPKEFTICFQGLQIRNLQNAVQSGGELQPPPEETE